MFRKQSVPLLIATDVGSRGLDIPEVAVVINWEVPRVADDYVHRVGRTARAGRKGVSITFVTEGDVDLVHVLEERISESPPSEYCVHETERKRNRYSIEGIGPSGGTSLGTAQLCLDSQANGQHGTFPFLPPVGRGLMRGEQALHSQGFGKKRENNKTKNERAGGEKVEVSKGRVWKNKPGVGGTGANGGGGGGPAQKKIKSSD